MRLLSRVIRNVFVLVCRSWTFTFARFCTVPIPLPTVLRGRGIQSYLHFRREIFTFEFLIDIYFLQFKPMKRHCGPYLAPSAIDFVSDASIFPSLHSAQSGFFPPRAHVEMTLRSGGRFSEKGGVFRRKRSWCYLAVSEKPFRH